MTQPAFVTAIATEIADIVSKVTTHIINKSTGLRLITGADHSTVEIDAKDSLNVLMTAIANSVFFLETHTTTNITEGTKLFYTDARARAAISESITGLEYSPSTGVFSLTAGYAIPTTVELANYLTAYNESVVGATYNTTTGRIVIDRRVAADINVDITLQPFDTDDLQEGSTNKYYSDSLVDARINALRPEQPTITTLSLTPGVTYTASDLTAIINKLNNVISALQASNITA